MTDLERDEALQRQIWESRCPELLAELTRHGKGKCVPADEFEKAKEPIFAEGMRAGCEDLMREAARMDDELTQLREDVANRDDALLYALRKLARLRERVQYLEGRVPADDVLDAREENARLRAALEWAADRLDEEGIGSSIARNALKETT